MAMINAPKAGKVKGIVQFLPLIGFLGTALLFWPGLLRPDSITQMQQGVAGVFNDFHPPMLGFVWGLFDSIHKGPGPILLLHLGFYWGAVALYAHAEIHKAKWFFLMALFPPVLAYQLLIIKDIAFVNSYLFAQAWLHFYSVRGDHLPGDHPGLRPSLLSLLGWCIVVFYGTACAYQAAVVLPWLCLWLGKIYWPSSIKKWFYGGGLVFVVLITGVEIFNRTMTTPTHSSQHLKLYDLAGISKQLDQPIFPDYLRLNPSYDFERIKNLYNPTRVDDLTFINDTPLPQAVDELQRQALQTAWLQAIIGHPIAYLKHRWGIFWTQLTVSLLKRPSEIKGETTSTILNLLTWLGGSWFFSLAKWLMAYLGYLVGQIFLIYHGSKHFNAHPKYVSLFLQNLSSLTLTGALFWCARAAEARYTYLGVAMCCFSLPLLLKSYPTLAKTGPTRMG